MINFHNECDCSMLPRGWDNHNQTTLCKTIVSYSIQKNNSDLPFSISFCFCCYSHRKQDNKGNVLRSYNLPVGAHIMVDDNEKIKEGKILVKIPRKSAKSGDITGGLPRVTELFEARNPSNPAVVSEIDGVVSFGKIKRGNREIIVESKFGDVKKYLVKLSNQILVQENDFVKAGMPLSDGSITPLDILSIKGPSAVQQYLVNEVQEVYRLQGVKINDKHFEVVVRQMMRKVKINDPGDTL